MSSTESGSDSRASDGSGVSNRLRAVVAGISVTALSLRAGTTAVFVTGGVVVLLALAVLARPEIRTRWTFNVVFAGAFAAYGVAYALPLAEPTDFAFGGLAVVLAVLIAANHLGVAPWSDHPRRI